MSLFNSLFGKNVESREVAKERLFSSNENSFNTTQSVNDSQEKKNPISVFVPKSYDEVASIIDTMKQGKNVIVHLTAVKNETAIRIVDFLSGAVYALGGGVYEMQKNIFMFSPNGVEVNQ